MTLFEWLRLIHLSCALLSISGFALRGYWVLSAHPFSQKKLTRTVPHIVDTLLLGSAVAMLVQWGVSPFAFPWLTAKLVALLVYIGLGIVFMRFAKSRATQWASYLMALLTAAYIVSVAISKSPLGFIHWVFG